MSNKTSMTGYGATYYDSLFGHIDFVNLDEGRPRDCEAAPRGGPSEPVPDDDDAPLSTVWAHRLSSAGQFSLEVCRTSQV